MVLDSLGSQNIPLNFDVAIVGGGLGGVHLAIGLLRHGVSVKIYEAAEGFGEIGAGVACGINAVNAMTLISPDILSAFKKHSTVNRSKDQADVYLNLIPVTKIWSDDRPVPVRGKVDAKTGTLPRTCVHRAHFLSEIVKLVPNGTAVFGKSLAKLEELPLNEGGRVRLHFTDGTVTTADAVIGCDGIRSVVRTHLHGSKAQPKYTGECAFRALVPASEFEAAMGPELTYNAQIWMGDTGYVVTYPVDHGRSINTVACNCRPGSEWKHGKWIIPANQQELLSDFRKWPPNLISLIAKHSFKDRWAVHDLSHDQPYFRGRVCLLGDACHATSPHLGSGASLALEDAFILSNLIGQAINNNDCAGSKITRLTKAFQAYDAVRRPRTQQVIRDSRKSGLMLSGQMSEYYDLNIFQQEELQLFNHVWNEDLPQTLKIAIEMMDQDG